jgi:hypothetical protein
MIKRPRCERNRPGLAQRHEAFCSARLKPARAVRRKNRPWLAMIARR